jgi:DNA-binding MarR family transcriptional regulator
MLGRSGLKLLEIMEEGDSVSKISEKLGLSLNGTSKIVKSLKENGFINAERKGKKKIIRLSEAKHAQLFKKITKEYEHIDFAELLSGSALEVIYLLDERKSASEIAKELGTHRRNIHRILRKLMDRGVVGRDESKYNLLGEFRVLQIFAKEFYSYVHSKLASEFSSDAVVVWQNLREFIIRTDREEGAGNFRLTGPDRFGEFGVPLLTTKAKYYFYSQEKEKLDLEDILIHTLLIEPKSTSTVTYCLVLLAKQRKKIDMGKLLKLASKYKIKDRVQPLFDYIESKGRRRKRHYPYWGEFLDKARLYNVIL